MAKKWVVSAKKADFNAISARFGISPYLARIIRNRDLISDEEIEMYLNGTLDMMHSPDSLKDIDIACDILMDAIDSAAPIRIVGDYDIDGVCASYILRKGLEYQGACVDVRLPDRVKDGYGINSSIIQEACSDGIELIITCDNGIAAYDEILEAINLGMSVIVTDHHEVPFTCEDGEKRYTLPPADAIIDPKQTDCTYPFDGICGAMVAYKLIQHMLRSDTSNEKKALMEELLSFAAFATVGDVMELVDENRIAVKYGIEILRRTSNIGMRSLINVTGIEDKNINVFHIGFVLGPCINASGRLDTATRALELFYSESIEEATVIAKELYDLNESRKNMTISFAKEAISIAEEKYARDTVLVVFIPSCHESIAGIVAGRIRERFYKPTIVLTLDSEGGVKGSARSIEGYNIHEELTKVSSLLTKFGGHKMAAGLSLAEENVDELRRQLNANSLLTPDDIIEKLVIDIPMPIGYISLDFVKEIDRLAPFGVSNTKPLFAQKDVPIRQLQLLGKNKNVLKLSLTGIDPQGKEISVEAVLFENAQEVYNEIEHRDKISILYQAGVNEYMGKQSVQLMIKDWY